MLNWHKYNWNKSEKLKKGIQKELNNVKNTDFREYLQNILNGIDRVYIPYAYPMHTSNTITNTITNTISNTISENEKPKENQKENAEKIIDLFNNNCPSLPKVSKLTEQRKKIINARLKEYSADELKKAFQLVEKSDFLTGRNGKWTGANFDWVMNPNNIVKILENNYTNKAEPKKEPPKKSNYDFEELEREIMNN